MRRSVGFPFVCFVLASLFPGSAAASSWRAQLPTIVGVSQQEARAKAQEPPSDPAESDKAEHGESASANEQETPEEEVKPRDRRRQAGIDPCTLTTVRGNAWIDKINRGLHRAVCASALWFDDLFGDEIPYQHGQGTYGRLLLGLEYDDREELDLFDRFRANFDLPNAERKLSVLVGRGDREELVEDRAPRTGALPNTLAVPDDDEWLIGLGYSPQRGSRRSSWSYDVGADVEFPLNWYARARYKRVMFPSNATMFRVRQTLFWEREDGWGTTSKLDFDYLLENEMLLRWRNVGTISEGDRGVDWYSELTLFQNRGERRALAYQLAASGETDAPVTVEYFLGRIIYRRSILRDWFFLDVRPGVSYRRDEGELERELRPMLAIGAEIVFGRTDRR